MMVPKTVAPVVLVARSVLHRPRRHPLRLGRLSMLQLTHFVVINGINITWKRQRLELKKCLNKENFKIIFFFVVFWQA